MAIETLLVTSTSQECGLQNDTDIWMVKNGNYNTATRHLVVRNGN